MRYGMDCRLPLGIECQHGLHQGKPGCIIQISKKINDQIFPNFFAFSLLLISPIFTVTASLLE